jgi:hypothetical protein
VRTRLIIAGVLIVIGLVWMGQGTGVIKGSGFMTDDVRWAVIGLVVFLAGAAVGAVAVIRRSRT